MKDNNIKHLTDVVYDLYKLKEKIRIGLILDRKNIQNIIDEIVETEEYKQCIEEAQKIPNSFEYDIEENEVKKEKFENYIDELVKRKILKYIPYWYYDRYEKIPYWLRPDYKQPTYWKEDTDMFRVHPESEPIYSDKTYIC